MPIKLVGNKVTYTGKTLWEILGNLKNFGVGRLVYKSHFLNYPETSYYKIVKVQPTMAPTDKYQNRLVMVWAEHVFRGTKYPELVRMHDRTYKPMFQLVPRSEEEKYLSIKLEDRKSEVPELHEWPPLMKIILEREAKKQGKTINPLKTVVVSGPNSIAVTKKNKLLQPTPPKLHADEPVAVLTERLQALKTAETPAP